MIDLLDFDGWIEKDRLLFKNGRRPMYGIRFSDLRSVRGFLKTMR